LAFLTPEELSYVEFQRFRRVPLTEDQGLTDIKPTTDLLRKESESDRAVMEAGIKAFVSYIRAYKEHHCKYIFQFDNLQIGYLASSFALLRLPKMRELKKAIRNIRLEGTLEGFVPSNIDPNVIAFKDKAREKQRQANASGRESLSTREEKRHGGPPAEAAPRLQQIVVQPRLTAAKRRNLEARQELEELNDDYALLRKLKKGKISQREYELATGEGLEEDGVLGTREGDVNGKAVKHTPDLVAKAVQKKAKKKKKKSSRQHRKADHE
jgi:ATP-dependent RNA helicase DDX55/SPB4